MVVFVSSYKEPERYNQGGNHNPAGHNQYSGGGGAPVKNKAEATAALGKVFLNPRSVGTKLTKSGTTGASYAKASRGNVDLEKKADGFHVTGEGVQGKAGFYAKELGRRGTKASAPSADLLVLHTS